MRFSVEDIAKLWESMAIGGPDDCWLWQKGHQGAGYGMISVGPKGSKKPMLAHRMSCELEHGPPTGKQFALHSCDNPPCCNPRHLRWGTPKDNVHDAIKRNRASPPPRNTDYRRRDTQPKGEKLWNQSLTESVVREIWRLHLAGGITTSAIASRVGAKQHAVADVVRGRSWRHLEGAPSVEALKGGGVRRGHNQFS